MTDNTTQNGYRPIQTTDDRNDQEKAKQQRVDEEEEEARQDVLLPDEKCCCSCLQRLVSPYLFGFLVCLVYFLQSAAFAGTGGGVLTTIERRFQLKTSELAPFLNANDIMSVFLVLFVAYYGHTSHRPRLIGAGGITVGVGLLLCTLPQFIYETPTQFSIAHGGGRNENGTAKGFSSNGKSPIYPVCQIAENPTGGADNEVCTVEEVKNSGSLMWQVSWIIIGQMMTGIGAAPISPLAVTFMDDSLKRSSTSVYVACMFISSSLGPLVGFTISSFSLSRHADFYKAPVYAQPGDPNWIGAWWLSYAITGVLIIFVSVPIVLFPKKIPIRVKKGSNDADEENQDGANVGEMYRLNIHKRGQGKCAYVKGFLSAIRRLVTNLTFMSLILGVCAFLASLSGSFVFMAKYIETQFGVAASAAPMIFGLMMTPGALFGNLIGGFVVKKLKLTKKGMARMVVVLKPFALLLGVLFFFIGCDNRDIAGITASYPTMNTTTTFLPNLLAGCNADCACPADYTPICGSDGVTYATPCHAGCLAMVEGMPMEEEEEEEEEEGNITMYANCSCVGDSVYPSPRDNHRTAVPGECPSDCNSLIPFVAVAMVGTLLGTVMGNPGFMLQLRTVHDDDRSVAIGFTSMMLRLFGFIPTPFVFGSAIQTACLLLQSSCGKTGNCLVYDIVHFRHVFFALSLGFNSLAMLAFIVCYFSIRETKQAEGFHAMTEVNSNCAMKSADPRTVSDDQDNVSATVAYKQSGV